MKLWQFYVAFGLQFFELAKYGVIRSLLSKCVHKDETGKMFSALAVIASIVPMIGKFVISPHVPPSIGWVRK